VNNAEARALLTEHLARYRGKSYSELARLVDQGPVTIEVAGSSGATYQIEILAVWDTWQPGDVHVLATIDDGGWRAFVPLFDSFIMNSAGGFLGESSL
jgi:hypothetical protein